MKASGTWVIVVALLLVAAPVRADGADAEVERLANHAMKAYRAADYAGAVALLSRAYALRPIAPLLFNLARAYDKLGDGARACESYRRFVEHTDAEPKLAAKARARLGTCPTVEPPAAAAAPPPPATPPAAAPSASPAPAVAAAPVAAVSLAAAPPAPVYKKWWLWTIVGVAAAGAAVGIAVGVTQSAPSPFNPTLPEGGPGVR